MIVVVSVFAVLFPPFVLAVVMMIVIMPTSTVAVAIPIPVVIVLEPASRSIPVSCVVSAAFIVRHHPHGTFIRPPRPVARVPQIASVHRIPVTIHPGILRFRPRTRRPNCHHAWRRRRTDLNSDGDLTFCCRRSSNNRSRQHQRSHSQFPIESHLRSLRLVKRSNSRLRSTFLAPDCSPAPHP